MKFKSLLLLVLFILAGTLPISAQNSSDITTFVLVRHAEKVDDSEDPDLSTEGYQRAERLAEMLQNIPFDAIYSTSRIRTTETVRLIAEANSQSIIEYDAGEPDEVTNSWIEQHAGETILVSGHSNTVPHFANALLGDEYYKDIFDETDFGNLLIITIDSELNRKILPLRY